MKKSLPHFSALTAIVLASAAMAQPPPAPSAPNLLPSSPGRGQGESASSGRGLAHFAVSSEQNVPVPLAGANEVTERTGDRLLMQATSQLDRRASISARLRYQTSLGREEQYGVGTYWQQGSGDELKIRLELQIAGQDAKLLQVSDSRFLWIDRRLPTGRIVTRYDLRQLRTDPALAPPDLDKLDPGKANWSAVQPLLTAHSGGLPSLLAALGDNFSFLPPQAMRLAIEPSVATQPSNIPVFAVVGHWKPQKLAPLLVKADDPTTDAKTPKKSKTPKAPSIPDRLPQEVLLLVGQADLFPYRIEYRRLETPAATNAEGPSIPYQLSVHPLVVVELSDVTFDSPVAAGQFDYTPGDAIWVDQTAGLLERLRHERQAQVASRSPDHSATPTR